MEFEVVGEIRQIETIVVGNRIREVSRLRDAYGPGRRRNRKGIATIRFLGGNVSLAEVHWYEAHGIGRKEMKVKRLLEDETI